MLIGLTGKYCAGKNHVAAILEKRGLPVIDVDKLGYEVLETEKEAIFAQFGSDLRTADGTLNRRLLGQRVFGNAEKLAALEAIVHPPVNRLIDDWIRDNAKREETPCVINAALIHRAEIFSRLDRIILVTAPFFTRLLRARRRDKLPWREILRRFSKQKDFHSKYLTGNAEIYRIENSGFSGSLESQIDKLKIGAGRHLGD